MMAVAPFAAAILHLSALVLAACAGIQAEAAGMGIKPAERAFKRRMVAALAATAAGFGLQVFT